MRCSAEDGTGNTLHGAMRQLKEAHAGTLKALCTASKGGHDMLDGTRKATPIDEAMRCARSAMDIEVVRAAVATDLQCVPAPDNAWLKPLSRSSGDRCCCCSRARERKRIERRS